MKKKSIICALLIVTVINLTPLEAFLFHRFRGCAPSWADQRQPDGFKQAFFRGPDKKPQPQPQVKTRIVSEAGFLGLIFMLVGIDARGTKQVIHEGRNRYAS